MLTIYFILFLKNDKILLVRFFKIYNSIIDNIRMYNYFRLPEEVQNEIIELSNIASEIWEEEGDNASNISINLTDIYDKTAIHTDELKFIKQPFLEKYKNTILLITGNRDLLSVIKYPEIATCIILIAENATGYYMLSGGENDFVITEDIDEHLKYHHQLKLKDKSKFYISQKQELV